MKIRIKSFGYYVYFGLIVSLFLLPVYFAIDISESLPLFSIQRILLIISFTVCVFHYDKLKIVMQQMGGVLFLFIIYLTLTYISALNAGAILDKSWFSIVLEQFLAFTIFLFFTLYESSVDEVIKILKVCTLILCILGLMEFFSSSSMFALLETSSRGLAIETMYRNGFRRIMGPFVHPLAYGIVLTTMFPICCYNLKTKKIDFISNIALLGLIVINMILTGARSTLLILLVEIFLLLFLTNEKKNKFSIFITIVLLAIVIGIYISFTDSVLSQYMIFIIQLLSDMVFGSFNYANTYYSADTTLGYRYNLINLFFDGKHNLLIGNGFENYLTTGWVSVDNFYILQLLKIGILGVVSYLLIILYITGRCARNRKASKTVVLLVAVVAYCMHVFVADELHTISVLFLILAMLYSLLIKT